MSKAKKNAKVKKSKVKSKANVKVPAKPIKKAAAKPAKKAAAKPTKKVASKTVASKTAPKPAAKPKAKAVTARPVQLKSNKSARTSGFLTPLDDRILIEKLGASDRTPGGLYIPEMAQERPNKGKVIAVGQGHRDKKGRMRPLDVKVGDVVLFTKWSGGEIELDGTAFLIMREADVLGISLD